MLTSFFSSTSGKIWKGSDAEVVLSVYPRCMTIDGTGTTAEFYTTDSGNSIVKLVDDYPIHNGNVTFHFTAAELDALEDGNLKYTVDYGDVKKDFKTGLVVCTPASHTQVDYVTEEELQEALSGVTGETDIVWDVPYTEGTLTGSSELDLYFSGYTLDFSGYTYDDFKEALQSDSIFYIDTLGCKWKVQAQEVDASEQRATGVLYTEYFFPLINQMCWSKINVTYYSDTFHYSTKMPVCAMTSTQEMMTYVDNYVSEATSGFTNASITKDPNGITTITIGDNNAIITGIRPQGSSQAFNAPTWNAMDTAISAATSNLISSAQVQTMIESALTNYVQSLTIRYLEAISQADYDAMGSGRPSDTVYVIDNSTPAPTPHDYSQDYLTIQSREDNNAIDLNFMNEIEMSTDGANWVSASSITLNSGDTVMLKRRQCINSSDYIDNKLVLMSSGKFDVFGNIMSLHNGDNFSTATTILPKNMFNSLFMNSEIVNAENLVLPATSLTKYCYGSMFQGCTSLATAPKLPATTLAEGCYWSMFNGCTSLTTAPDLTASILVADCYKFMFYGCENLISITCLATDNSAQGTDAWVQGVALFGTFTKAASMTSWSSDSYGIPYDWTIVDYQE